MNIELDMGACVCGGWGTVKASEDRGEAEIVVSTEEQFTSVFNIFSEDGDGNPFVVFYWQVHKFKNPGILCI